MLVVDSPRTRRASTSCSRGVSDSANGGRLAPLLMRRRAAWADSEAVLPAYIIGMVLAGTVGKDHALIRRLQETNSPDIAMSCPPTEGPLLGGVKPRHLPPGRALLCTRRGSRLIQTAWSEPTAVPVRLITLPSAKVTVTIMGLLKSTSPACETSSSAKLLRKLGAGASV